MDYFAFEGGVTTVADAGAIPITDKQYADAIEGICSGLEVTLQGGFQLRQQKPSVLHTWDGNAWVEPAPTIADPLSLPLARLKFWLAAAEIGVYKPAVRASIDAMPESPSKYEAIIWFEEATVYRRNDPLLIQLAAAEGIVGTQLDALWIWALDAA